MALSLHMCRKLYMGQDKTVHTPYPNWTGGNPKLSMPISSSVHTPVQIVISKII